MFNHGRRAFWCLLPDGLTEALKSTLQWHRTRLEYSRGGRVRTALSTVWYCIAPRRRILFYPKGPSEYQVFYKLCSFLGYRIITRLHDRYDLAVNFQPITHAEPAALAALAAIPVVVNRRCTDVSKTRVQEAFASVFHYPLAVEPTKYAGRIVEKSDENFRHDGRILQGPIAPSAVRNGCVYQRAVRNEEDQGHISDLRVPIYGGRVPLVYKRIRRIEHRFGYAVNLPVSEDVDASAEILEPQEVFTQTELAQLALLAEELGLDYGEMDVLRDNEDRLIYVVDVNNTPGGPVTGLGPQERVQAIKRLSQAFEELIEIALTEERGMVRAHAKRRPQR
jgi:hypothetical protein